jgi:hypothetical protein
LLDLVNEFSWHASPILNVAGRQPRGDTGLAQIAAKNLARLDCLAHGAGGMMRVQEDFIQLRSQGRPPVKNRGPLTNSRHVSARRKVAHPLITFSETDPAQLGGEHLVNHYRNGDTWIMRLSND